MNIEKTLKEGKKHHTAKHLGISTSIVSILYGLFIIFYNGYFTGLIERYVSMDDENAIGVALVIVGLIKLIGLIINNTFLKRLGIYLLSFVWGALLGVSLVYSFGVGYPNPMPIFMGKIVWDCWRVALKGDFGNE